MLRDNNHVKQAPGAVTKHQKDKMNACRRWSGGINARPQFWPGDNICSSRLCQRSFPLHELVCKYAHICVHVYESCIRCCAQFMWAISEQRIICRGRTNLLRQPRMQTLLSQGPGSCLEKLAPSMFCLQAPGSSFSPLSGLRVMTISNIQTRGQGKCFKVTQRVITAYTFQTSVQLQIH